MNKRCVLNENEIKEAIAFWIEKTKKEKVLEGKTNVRNLMVDLEVSDNGNVSKNRIVYAFCELECK